jgi:hypothetical protein
MKESLTVVQFPEQIKPDDSIKETTDMINEMDKKITGIGYSVNDQMNNERVSSGRAISRTNSRFN